MPPDLRLQELLSSVPGKHSAPNPTDAIVVESLAKRYPNGTEAVRGISFRVVAGEEFGLLGPNGAGKSTTMGMLGALVRPTAGSASVAGYDVADRPREVRRRIGFPMQEVGVDAFATGQRAGRAARSAPRSLASRGRGACWPVARSGWPQRRGRPSDGRVLGRDAAPCRSRPGADPPAAGALPRRAHRGSGPARPDRDLGDARATQRHARHDDHAHHPLHGGGRPPLRSDRDRRPRPDRRRGTPAELKARTGTADPVTLEDVYLHSTGRTLEVAA